MEQRTWLIVGGCALAGMCGVIALAIGIVFVAGLGVAATAPTVGPTFTTAEALAYDVVYETSRPDSGTIEILQTEPAGRDTEFQAVLVGFEQEGQRMIDVIIAEPSRQEFFVINFLAGSSASQPDFTTHTRFHESLLDSEILIYGQLLNPDITRVTATWPIGYELEATVAQDSYLFFQSWSPADGSPAPAKVTAYGSDGAVISEIDLTSSP